MRALVLKANAAADEKTSGETRRAQFTSTSQDLIWSGDFTPYRVVLPLKTVEDIHTGRNNRMQCRLGC
ncbi:hypothetical protein VZT92_020675 [Zoarces viviparus]|uniref:Uncharacterized protein n=1 Tax=Zoarces viviparus TaxID=48416 RepID=A0AAW1EG43_ZOAVI